MGHYKIVMDKLKHTKKNMNNEEKLVAVEKRVIISTKIPTNLKIKKINNSHEPTAVSQTNTYNDSYGKKSIKKLQNDDFLTVKSNCLRKKYVPPHRRTKLETQSI